MAPANTTTDDDWQRLGKAIEDRRFQLDLSQEALVQRGGPSHQTVRNVERGIKADYRPTTFRKFDRALSWPDGTSMRILRRQATDDEIDSIVHSSQEPPPKRGGWRDTTARVSQSAPIEPETVSMPPERPQDATEDTTAIATYRAARKLLELLLAAPDPTPRVADLVRALQAADFDLLARAFPTVFEHHVVDRQDQSES